jgi:hypothetical protein
MALHPAYQAIIKLGSGAVPLILEEMKREPDHWFIALRKLTGADPVKPEQQGDITKMTREWIEWSTSGSD